MSVVFDFNALLNDDAPLSSITFPIVMTKERFVYECRLCVFFLLYSHLRLSAVSVVFDFNDSLNDVAPLSPILLSVVKRKEKSELSMDVFRVSSVFTA